MIRDRENTQEMRRQCRDHRHILTQTSYQGLKRETAGEQRGPGLQEDMPYVDSGLGVPSSSTQFRRELMGRIPRNLMKGKYLNRASEDMGSLLLLICSFTQIFIDELLLAGHHLGF